MADPAPRQRRWPVGFGFRPTDEELVGYYLRHKLMADDPLIYDTIPEIDVCKHEPWDILAWAASVIPGADPDDSECYFFSPRDYKYSKTSGNRLKRTTSLGYWKLTGRGQKIKVPGTNNVIGKKKNLVFYRGRFPHADRSNWVIHEYHEPLEKGMYVLCKLIKKYERKATGKSSIEHESIHEEESSNNYHILEYENQANFYDISEEPSFQLKEVSSQPKEVTDSITQVLSQPKEVTDPITQVLSQPKEVTDPITQVLSQLEEITDPITQVSSQPKEVTETQVSSQPIEVTETQVSSQPKEVIYPITQASSYLKENIDFFQSNQVIDAIQRLSPSNDPNSTIETLSDFDSEEFWNNISLMLNPTTDEQGLWDMSASSYMLYGHEDK